MGALNTDGFEQLSTDSGWLVRIESLAAPRSSLRPAAARPADANVVHFAVSRGDTGLVEQDRHAAVDPATVGRHVDKAVGGGVEAGDADLQS